MHLKELNPFTSSRIIHPRSHIIIKNVIGSLMLRTATIIINLLLVPLTLDYLDAESYGIWLTLTSIIGWLTLLDFGLGNGLRNRLSEAIMKKDFSLAKVYVSTSFAIVSIIVFVILIGFWIFFPLLNWANILNTSPDLNKELGLVAGVVFTFFCLQFIFKLLSSLLWADQKSMINDLISVIGSLLSLITIYILTKTTHGSLLFVSFAFSVWPLLILLGACFVFFNGKYKNMKPSFAFINFKYTNDLLGLGMQFFIIQIACMIIYSSSNIIISHLFGPVEVTPYNIAFKYFSVLSLGFTIIVTPTWSAFTEAYLKKEYRWIHNTMKRLILIWVGSIIVAILMVIFSEPIYKLWVGESIKIPFLLSLLNGLYIIIFNWNSIFAYFINGVGKVRLQLYVSVISCVAYIPLAIFLGQRIGVPGVILSMSIVLLASSIYSPIQYFKIIKNRAVGIWGK